MRNLALVGMISLALVVGAASAKALSVKPCAMGQKCAAQFVGESRAALIGDDTGSPAFVGRGVGRGQSMYFSSQQDDAYRSRF
jgi:hypothetical protein